MDSAQAETEATAKVPVGETPPRKPSESIGSNGPAGSPESPRRDEREASDRGAFASPDSGLTINLDTFRHNPDLVVVALLLLATACGSRGFSQAFQVGPFYVTELMMGLAGLIAIVRLGVGRSWLQLKRLPLIALAIIWVAGVYASFRGLNDWGFSKTSNDIGLFDYSLILPLFALVVADRERYDAMFATLVGCGFVGLATFFVTFWADQISGTADSIIALQGQAAGLYMSLAVFWIAARLVNRVPTPTWLAALAPIGLVMMALTSQRSVLIIAILGLGAVVACAPRPMVLRSAAVSTAAFVLAIALAIGIQAGLNATLGGVEDRTETAVVADGLGFGGVKASGDSSPQITRELGGLSGITGSGGGGDGDGGGGDGGGNVTAEADNVTWRFAYWREILSRVPSAPIAGVGFGQPGDFRWDGRKYDFRDGDPGSGIDVAGPHNSFVSWIYRLGIPAALAFLFVMFVGVRNVWRGIRSAGSTVGDRVTLSTLLGMFGGGVGVSLFNESLTGPFLGLFFWAPLAMLILWAALKGSDPLETKGSDPA